VDVDRVDGRGALARILSRNQQFGASVTTIELGPRAAVLLEIHHRHLGQGIVETRQERFQCCAFLG
jgi:hypothetical protein